MNEVNQNKESIKDILNNFNISKVVYVDDYNVEISVEKVITSQKRNSILKEYFPEIIIGDIDIENAKLREQWKNINFETKSKIGQIIKSSEDTYDIDIETIPLFAELISENFFYPLSPENWEKQKTEFLLDSKTTLFLFDQDLKMDGRDEGGIRIIKEISTNNDIICGLFTQKTTEDGYFEYRDKMCEKHSINKDKFFVIPKETVKNDMQLFLHLLKLTILGKDFKLFKTNVNSIIKQTNDNVKDKIEKIKVEDFEHIIFQVPKIEGLWEPDMFFRIYSGFQRHEFISLAYSNAELKNSISKIRSVSDIPTKSDSFNIPSDAWDIQHNELYENSDYLNNNHLPIEVGDIFEDINKNIKYILLAQPCDLMIRGKDGKRSRSSNRLALIKIKKLSEEEKKDEKAYLQEVKYFGTIKDERWYVNFKDIFYVKSFILDLCIFHQNGISQYSSIDDFHNNNFRSALIKHYIEIKKEINKKIDICKSILGRIKGDTNVKKYIYESILEDDLFKVEYEENDNSYTIKYNCKRIGRLTYERAIGLLAEFHSILARHGYPPEYGQE